MEETEKLGYSLASLAPEASEASEASVAPEAPVPRSHQGFR
ncbi:MAG: hypothetical protein SWY16_09100 [Cyanobacteriota bacterium]|nr:hypothetical protein [Cyanobacteriota bacterium]